MGRKEGYADPVAIASFSMDPAIIAWLNKYAHEHKTTKSWIVRKALLDFQEKYDPKKWTCKGCGTEDNDPRFETCFNCNGPKS